MFGEEEQIAYATRSPILDERALQRERVGIGDQSKLTDFYTALGSQFSSDRLTWDMNWSATAPSITRWS